MKEICTPWCWQTWILTPGETEPYQSSGTGLWQTFLETRWMMGRSSLIFCFHLYCQRGTGITDLDILFWNSRGGLTIPQKEALLTLAAQICQKAEDQKGQLFLCVHTCKQPINAQVCEGADQTVRPRADRLHIPHHWLWPGEPGDCLRVAAVYGRPGMYTS